MDREGAARRVPTARVYPTRREPLAAREARRRVRRPAPGCQRVRETGVPSALSSNWVFALCPSFSSSSCSSPTSPTPPLLSAAVPGVSLPACGAGARGPGVQPAAVECLFSKDSEIKKVEFTDSPESRKEAASSKLFPRQHPGATGKAGSEAQAARRAPASGPLGFGQGARGRGRHARRACSLT